MTSEIDAANEAKAREMLSFYANRLPEITIASTEEICSLLRDQSDHVVVIDVRTNEERAISRIPKSISQAEFEKTEWTSFDKSEKLFIPYCTIGYRSGLYAMKLRANGFEYVKNGEGIILWTHRADMSLVDESGRVVNLVHTFGRRWQLASMKYQTTYFSNVTILAMTLWTYFTHN